MDWLRWHHGAVSDDKWPLIARKSGQSVAVVVAIWAALLECASQSEDRGAIHDFDPESIDALLQLPDGTTQAVVDALSSGMHPRIADGRIVNWEKRQPARERDGDNSVERVRRHREHKKVLQNQDVTPSNASVTPSNASVTPSNASVTPSNASVTPPEQRREDKNINTSPPVDNPVNEDPARSPERRRGVEGKASPPDGEAPAVVQDEPGIEFVELREAYNAVRPEGPLAGFAEYRQLKAARDRTGRSLYPGNFRLMDDFTARMSAGFWNPGYALGLAQYLKTRLWEQPVKARASPGPAKSWQDRESEANIAAFLAEP